MKSVPSLVHLRLHQILLPIALVAMMSLHVQAETRGLAVVASSIAGQDIQIGKQYAILIGIDTYHEWNPLRNPVKDAQAIKEILQRRYYIDEFMELYNEDATSSGIRKLFSSLIDKVKPNDSVLIYYAGHGFLDEFNTGFWIPVDGGKDLNEQDHWIPNGQIRNFVAKMKAHSVALISDSCFSGDLLNVSRGSTPTIDSAYYRNALKYTARQVLTSGASEAVPDESEFARQFKAILENNTETCLDPLGMFDRIKRGVTETIPLYGTLPGHENGGSYILFLKDTKVEIQVSTIKGWIEIPQLPQGAQIMLNGKKYEVTYNKGIGMTSALNVGKYNLYISAPYTRPVTLPVVIEENKATTVILNFAKYSILNLNDVKPELKVEVSTLSGTTVNTENSNQYELNAGDYIVKAKMKDDIDWAYKGKVNIPPETTISISIPAKAQTYSISWQMKKEQDQIAVLKSGYDSSLNKLKTHKAVGTASLIAGGVSGIAAGALYFLGTSAMSAYKGAQTASDAQDQRSKISLYNSMFIATASFSGVGLGFGGIYLATSPKPERLNEQVQSSIEQLRKLEAKKLAESVDE